MNNTFTLEELTDALNETINEMQKLATALENANMLGDNFLHHSLLGGLATLSLLRENMGKRGMISNAQDFNSTLYFGEFGMSISEIR